MQYHNQIAFKKYVSHDNHHQHLSWVVSGLYTKVKGHIHLLHHKDDITFLNFVKLDPFSQSCVRLSSSRSSSYVPPIGFPPIVNVSCKSVSCQCIAFRHYNVGNQYPNIYNTLFCWEFVQMFVTVVQHNSVKK